MKNFLIICSLLLAMGCADANDNTPVTKPTKNVMKELRDPPTRCLNGVVYYVVRTSVTHIDRAYGYGFLAPKVDDVTLDFVRCRKQNGELIQEK